jgi:2-dehydropantoate 2-reductase
VLAVKSGDLDGAMADIEPAVKPPAVIVPFLNGMAHVEALSGRFGSPVLGGVLRVATELEDDGTIRVLTPQFDVELGELDGSPSTRVDRLAAAFKDAGADVTVPGNIIDAMCAAGADLIAGRRTEVEAVLADLAARARAAGTAPALIDLAVLALRVHNRQVGS